MFKILLATAVAFGLIGCGGGSTATSVDPTPVEVIVEPAPVEVVVVLPEDPQPESEEIFKGVRVAYDTSDLTCKGGSVRMTMTMKRNDLIDSFSFIVEHGVDGNTFLSSPNINSEGEFLILVDMIYIEKNKSEEIKRHTLSLYYYGEEVERLTGHYFDQEACEKDK